ncbi:MAG: carbohydrate kinase family protein [Ruminococcus sp.]|nr:carbohydrate kinase family protein [Ruminococcus sp.]
MKIYLYGMICASNSFKTAAFPSPDEYTEIEQSARFIGGETGTCATVLSSLGQTVRIDGTHIGRSMAALTREFYKGKSVDLSSLTFDEDFEGLEDYIIIHGDTRTPLGRFGHFFGNFYSGGAKHWNEPKENDALWCDAAAIDDCFGEDSKRCAEACIKHGKPYVTIDCKYDSFIHKHAAVTVVSGEALKMHYGDAARSEMLPLYCENTDGLTIITNGSGKFFYGRRGKPVKAFTPFKVSAESTLGAGDTFKAGCTYALAHGMGDDELVSFASACAAVAVSRYPSQLRPPKLSEVEAMLRNKSSAECVSSSI